ncbi:MAG: DegQ family serine endoprotease [SAR324 cluster bacterium]|nr:DegQ family serine endoprotease [SAR324 cluster bacterium]
MKIRWTIGVIFSALFLLAGTIWADNHNPALEDLIKQSKARADVAEKAQKAVVHIRVEKMVQNPHQNLQFNNPYDLFNHEFFDRYYPELRQKRQQPPQQRQFKQEGLGSGAIIDEKGHILTNNHVVGGADKITVNLTDGREFDAKLVGTDPQSDIAVIKIEGDALPQLPLGNSDEVRVGESVIAIGNPFGLSYTITMGIVSAKGRSRVGIADYEDFIQTDAAINPGNSGGPLINLNGEIIGVNTAIFSRSGGYQGIGFAVPVNMAKQIAEELIGEGSVSRGWLGVGIQDLTPELAKRFGQEKIQGSLITAVMPDSPADKSGILAGDVVLRFNGKQIQGSDHLRNETGLARPGSKVKVELIRKGKTEVVTVTLGERPKQGQIASTVNPAEDLGMTVQELSADIAKRLGYDQTSGVVIANVAADSPAAAAGLRSGMLILEVNQENVEGVQSFYNAIKNADLKAGVLLLVQWQNGSRYIILKS